VGDPLLTVRNVTAITATSRRCAVDLDVREGEIVTRSAPTAPASRP
jgi:hypothetical protein